MTDRIRSALQYVPADDRDTWLRIGMAIKSEVDDFDIWDTWSQQADNYNASDAQAVWRSIKPDGAVTIATLFHEAQAHGWRDDGPMQSPEALAERKQQAEQRRAKDQADIQSERANTAAKAAAILKAATPAQADHPYLARKQVSPVETLREIDAAAATEILNYKPKSGGEVLTGRLLVVPVKQGDGISTLELIDPAGRKTALAGRGTKSGGYWSTQRLAGDLTKLLIGEGVATVLSAAQATRHPAIAALSSCNLVKVANTMRERHTQAELVILADLADGKPDRHAVEAAQSVNGCLAVPDLAHDSHMTDFNDMAVSAGKQAVADAIAQASNKLWQQSQQPPANVPDNVRTIFVSANSGELELAEYVADNIGLDNMLGTDTGLHIYSGTIWERYSEERWKHQVQRLLKNIPDIKLTARKVSSVANLLKTDAYRDGFDWPHDDGEAVACPNGVVRFDGSDWILHPHNREDYLTSTIPVEWQPDAQAPRFNQFLCEVFDGDPDAPDKATALLEMIGYTLMRHTRHERFIIIVGRGANGKSVLLFVIATLIGSDNIAAVSPDQLNRPFQRAALHQKLANVITELKQGEQVQDGALKSIVSGEPCTVERKFGHPFTMRPYATQWYGTNHLPHTRDFSFALFRRALIVPFNNKFTGKDADPDLSARLRDELPGILQMALTAYGQALQRGTFTEPDSCKAAKEAWRLEADQVHRWAEQNIWHEAGGWITHREAYRHYCEWAADMGIHKKVARQEFRDRMDRLEFESKRKAPGEAFLNVRLK